MIQDRIVRRPDGLFEICEVEDNGFDSTGLPCWRIVQSINLAFNSVIAISDRIGKMREAFEAPVIENPSIDLIHVVTFERGYFEDHLTFSTKIEARGFCKGFTSGSGQTDAMAFVVPDDEKQMRDAANKYTPWFENGELEKALNVVKGT